MKLILTLCLCAGLIGCAGDKQTQAVSALAIACESVAATLDQLAPRRASGALSTDAVNKANSAKIVTDKACMPDSPFDPASAVAIVQNAITILKGI